jgi:hypothetical protein
VYQVRDHRACHRSNALKLRHGSWRRIEKAVRGKELDGADGFAFDELGVGGDTEGVEQAGLYLL